MGIDDEVIETQHLDPLLLKRAEDPERRTGAPEGHLEPESSELQERRRFLLSWYVTCRHLVPHPSTP